MRKASILLLVLCGCSARVDEPATDAGTEATSDATDTADTGSAIDFDLGDAVVDSSRDTRLSEASASCPSFGDACRDDAPDGSSYDPAQWGAKQLVNDCLLVEWSCGGLHIDVDENGCVLGHWVSSGHDRAKFESCIADALAKVRFSCAPAGEFSVSIDSCTVK